MKILNIENHVNVVYVQVKDINFIIENTNYSIPDLPDLSTKSPEEFVRITGEDNIHFFTSKDYILNYKPMRDASIKNLELILDAKIKNRYEQIKAIKKASSSEEETQETKFKIAAATYEIEQLKDLISAKKTDEDIKLPLAIDFDAPMIAGHDFTKDSIKAGFTFDGNHLLFQKADETPFENEDEISKEKLTDAIMILAINSRRWSQIDELIKLDKNLSENNEYLISEKLPAPIESEVKSSRTTPKQFFKRMLKTDPTLID